MLSVDERVGANVATLRKVRDLSVRQLSEKMTEMGAKIFPSALTSLEHGKRRATAAEVLVLAHILRVNPNRILFPDRADITPTQITPTVATTASRAWAWADARWHLDSQYDPETPQAERYDDFRRHARPTDLRLREQHPAAHATRKLSDSVQWLLTMLEVHGPSRSQMQLLPEDEADRARELASAAKVGDAVVLATVARELSRVTDEVNALMSEAVGKLYQVDAPELAGQTVGGVRFNAKGTGFVRPGNPVLETMVQAGHRVTEVDAQTQLDWLKLDVQRTDRVGPFAPEREASDGNR